MISYFKRLAAVALVAVLLVFSAINLIARSQAPELVYVGSGHRNISAFWMNVETGALTPIGEVAEIKAPSFIAVSPNQSTLYAVSEGGNAASSSVSAYRIDRKSGQLTPLNSQPSGGSGPCHVSVDPKNQDVLVANYGSGSVSAFPIGADGSLGAMTAFIQDHGSSVNPQRQEGPHAHCIVTDPGDHFVLACDLGLDKVLIFKFNGGAGTLVDNDPPFATVTPGFGPRHIAFHPNGRFVYLVNELSSTVTAFAYDKKHGALKEIGSYPMLPSDFQGQNTAAEVAVHPSGKFVYASNRGDDSIVVFACNPGNGTLTFVERVPSGGNIPRNFAVDPTGRFLLAANQKPGTVVVFRIDTKTGRLQPTGFTASGDTPMCVQCIRFAN